MYSIYLFINLSIQSIYSSIYLPFYPSILNIYALPALIPTNASPLQLPLPPPSSTHPITLNHTLDKIHDGVQERALRRHEMATWMIDDLLDFSPTTSPILFILGLALVQTAFFGFWDGTAARISSP